MIKILHVRIQNLLSFQREALVKDAYPISVFVGANNAGKSNLIRAMLLYKNLLLHYKDKRETYSIKDEYYHRLGRNELSAISITYRFDDKNFSNHLLVIDHFILFNYQGYFDKEGFSLRKENGEEIRVIKKENSKTFINRRELVGDFLFDTKSGYTVSSPEVGFEEVPIGFHVPFFWPENDDSPGIRIFNEIKRYIESWVFIPADRLIEIDKRVKELQTQLYKKIKASSNLIDDMCKLVGVSDANFDEIGGKLTSIINDGPDISIGLAGQGSGLQEIFTIHPQIYEGNDKVFFIEEPEVHLHALSKENYCKFSLRDHKRTNSLLLHSLPFSAAIKRIE